MKEVWLSEVLTWKIQGLLAAISLTQYAKSNQCDKFLRPTSNPSQSIWSITLLVGTLLVVSTHYWVASTWNGFTLASLVYQCHRHHLYTWPTKRPAVEIEKDHCSSPRRTHFGLCDVDLGHRRCRARYSGDFNSDRGLSYPFRFAWKRLEVDLFSLSSCPPSYSWSCGSRRLDSLQWHLFWAAYLAHLGWADPTLVFLHDSAVF